MTQTILDQRRNAVNDNKPNLNMLKVKLYFVEYSIMFVFCFSGTVIGQVNATDKDQPKTPHTSIKFTLLNATDMFSIDPITGVITAKTNTLDREVFFWFGVVPTKPFCIVYSDDIYN